MSSPKVLIVEDHADTREMYATMLESAGFATAEAADVPEALEQIATSVPGAVVVDLRLGAAQTGLELCQQLAARPDTKPVPLIVVSGAVDPDTRGALETIGCVAILVKPVLLDALVSTVARVVDASAPEG